MELPVDKASEGEASDDIPYEMLFKVGTDSQGRRSVACRRLDSGKETAWADEFYEKDFPGRGENAIRRRAFREIDQSICWYTLDGWRPGLLTNAVRWLLLPILTLGLAFGHLKMRWGLFWERRRSRGLVR